MRYLILVTYLLVSLVVVKAEYLDEVNAQRARINLPPLIKNEVFTKFALIKAKWHAANQISVYNGNNGHEGPSLRGGQVPGGYVEGSGVTRPDNTKGWLSCVCDIEGSWPAGAGAAFDTEGNRYHVLLVQFPKGVKDSRRSPENLIATFHMTPECPVIDEDGNKVGTFKPIPTPTAKPEPVKTSPTEVPTAPRVDPF